MKNTSTPLGQPSSNEESGSFLSRLPEELRAQLVLSADPNSDVKDAKDPFVIRLDGGTFTGVNLSPDKIRGELSHFFSQLKGKEGKAVSDLFQGNLSEIIRTISGLKKQVGGKSLKHIVENLPQSLVPTIDSEEALDPLVFPYTHNLASGSPSQTTPVNSLSASTLPESTSSKTRQIAVPLDPLNASKAGERFRIFVVAVVILGLIGFLSWDWIMEILNIKF